MRTKLKILSREFLKNKRYMPEGATTETFRNNEFRNRYTDVVCLDSTRVVLKHRDNDYIHANWVTLPNGFKYICAQKYLCNESFLAPMNETNEDFWIMTLQEKCSVIVMLCDITEVGEPKCAQYWPDREDQREFYGQVSVRNVGIIPSGNDEIKYTQLEVEYNDHRTIVHHYRWSEWPDHLAPQLPNPVVELLKMAKARSNNKPVVVHCSAGIGRTGTFVSVDYANEKLRVAPDTTMLHVLKEVRSQRLMSVQSFLQYTYVHVCLLEYLAQINIIPRRGRYEAYLHEYREYLNVYGARMKKKRAEDEQNSSYK
ncbi:hypothetical protein L596_015702 [Steinernema carpocapsae]|uniref:Protein-tyrosine-phosphatase n=1 Tax=Steinernema carpocapsae TaxID=34508 RepID=A0A4V6A357_STECR|nr:hypothetical protein L596_015702 [Steinernema carpocapsae]